MLYYIAKLIYILIGWEVDKKKALSLWESKNVLIGFPHTSLLDTFITMVGIFILKKKAYTFIKKEAFFWPLSWVLKMNKAIPVDRNSSSGIVSQIVAEFNNRDEFSICIVPQGSRKKGSKVKTGFWHIAKQANASILCWYFDRKNKQCVCLGKVHPGESLEKDLKIMQKLYDNVGYEIQDGHQISDS
ncbi:MAG: 1-acyl-sn-glycerol-3-phosphate acyltransferase [Desulfobacterales bacterium]|nr:1-acyl-sn-glycerol-3-phosphate acyltransferase [Desulfobacterales bacterium]